MIRKGGRFGQWKVLSTEEYVDGHSNYYIYCKDLGCGKKKLVRKDYLLNERSSKCIDCSRKQAGGHSTRHKNHHLPKYVYDFNIPESLKKYRVASKIEGKVVTHGYFHTIKEAEKCVEEVV